uniref:Uncharacterized protein n=1 Tax=Lepeophtheirus salmonis TaxID=72036 RepID=A0A0K2TMG3_LEPSM
MRSILVIGFTVVELSIDNNTVNR